MFSLGSKLAASKGHFDNTVEIWGVFTSGFNRNICEIQGILLSPFLGGHWRPEGQKAKFTFLCARENTGSVVVSRTVIFLECIHCICFIV